MAAYEKALQQLYRAPAASFLAERKRLAAELRAAGEDEGAAQIAKRRKPTASVWAVNQLYWQARDALDEMLAAAARLRKGDAAARRPYHDAVGKLRKRAAAILNDAGHAASDATLRRVATTLAAIAAAGGFAPDPPGALPADRDPPGFEAAGIAAQPGAHQRHAPATRDDATRSAPPAKRGRDDDEAPPAQRARREHDARDPQRSRASDERARVHAEKARLRAAEVAERKRQQAERARRKERERLRSALRAATAKLRTRERSVAALEKQLRAAHEAARDAGEAVRDLERKLAELDAEE